MAELIQLRPAPRTDSETTRGDGDRVSVDDWGRDDQLVGRLGTLARLRWHVSAGGVDRLPARSGALLVTNQRRGSLSPIYVAWALGEATRRPVRFLGRPDIAPLGDALRRVGGLFSRPDELEGALRHGEMVVMSTSSTSHPRHAGSVDPELIGAAVRAGAAVFPVASLSTPLGRRARVEVGPAVRPRRQRRGPLAEVELATSVHHHLQKMLDELGGTTSGTAIDLWGPSTAWRGI